MTLISVIPVTKASKKNFLVIISLHLTIKRHFTNHLISKMNYFSNNCNNNYIFSNNQINSNNNNHNNINSNNNYNYNKK